MMLLKVKAFKKKDYQNEINNRTVRLERPVGLPTKDIWSFQEKTLILN